MRYGATVTIAVLFLTLPITVSAQTGDRLTDKEVKALLDSVDKGRDRFEDQLDDKLKNSILRLPNGEVNVARFLDDLQENTGRLKERFTAEYSAVPKWPRCSASRRRSTRS